MQDDPPEDEFDGMLDDAPSTSPHMPAKLLSTSSKFGYRVIETLIFSAGSLVGGILGAYGGAAFHQEGTVIIGFALGFTAGGFVTTFFANVLPDVRW